MKKEVIENFIQDIDKVINSESSRISKKDLEVLVKIREGLKSSSSQRDYIKYLDMLLKLIGLGQRLWVD
jgi:hypothetical protein